MSESERQIIHEEKIGRRDYMITGEEREVVNGWLEKIGEIKQMLDIGNIEELAKLADDGEYHRDVKQIVAELEQEGLDEEDKILLSISLWLLKEQRKDAKRWPIVKRFLKGGEFKLASFLDKEWVPNCLDSTVLIKVLAEQFGVDGQVKTIKSPAGKFAHRYFGSNSGKFVDIWWGYDRAGLFQDEKKFKETLKRDRHYCGTV
ncbi:MAG: hypothetical protein A2538_00455 [Candidatus Magasanikbacteria bacterium RIFOXYD2_FULL_41_14]|uniref:Uncharacterized protein n=1 Tax=Candidatus Magasanikbacteria bacterium RIFOXYD2_FULL_41_14 TaxID=1798709 RepID=A0A1F6PBX4_9BACT|nr:MAG: hypothetical protein A2538_00455 [Candidatus Magasanikbacteria bacterium RIFOXYD2_FULL_41_14]